MSSSSVSATTTAAMSGADGSGLQMQWISDKKQRGLVATRAFGIGDVLFEEEPIVCDQYLHNADYFPACAHCLKCLESPAAMARRLAELPEEPVLKYAAQFPLAPRVPCQHHCGEVYCSAHCQSAAWEFSHVLLCPAANPAAAQPLAALKETWKSFHYPPESSSIMIIAKLLAMLLIRRRAGMSLDDAFAPIATFKRDQQSDSLDILAKFMDPKFEAHRLALYQHLVATLRDERYPELFTLDAFHSLLCIVALNGQGVGTSSFEHYERLVQTHAGSDAAHLSELDALRAGIDEVSAEFTHAEGTALYSRHALLNHSCAANAEIRFPHNSARVQVVATAPIAVGDEACISYMHFHSGCESGEEEEEGDDDGDEEEEASVEERRAALLEYYMFQVWTG
ncbi:SET and MYND domain-containing protein 5 [Sorochytrium milnesiophthora]